MIRIVGVRECTRKKNIFIYFVLESTKSKIEKFCRKLIFFVRFVENNNTSPLTPGRDYGMCNEPEENDNGI